MTYTIKVKGRDIRVEYQLNYGVLMAYFSVEDVVHVVLFGPGLSRKEAETQLLKCCGATL